MRTELMMVLWAEWKTLLFRLSKFREVLFCLSLEQIDFFFLCFSLSLSLSHGTFTSLVLALKEHAHHS